MTHSRSIVRYFPFLFVRFREGAPVEAGVYLKASEVAAWLDLNGCPTLAAELREVETAPDTATAHVGQVFE